MTGTYDLLTLGETMLRLSPPDNLRFGQSVSLMLRFGGAESNVAANLARLGRRVSWWSRLPDNPLGHQLIDDLRGHGVFTDDVLFCPGERLGTYFIEYGTPPRGIKVWYDRANSAASKMRPDDVPDSWLDSGRWLHLSGITPALSDTCHETMQHVVNRAKINNTTLSFDVNYRSLLWSPDVAARCLQSFCRAADVVFIALRDAAQLFGVVEDTAAGVAQRLQSDWGGTVIVTAGDAGSAACDGKDVYTAAAYPAVIIDRIGAGDAFASGVLDRLLDGVPLPDALRFGAALAALKLTIPGDVAQVVRDDVAQLLSAQSQYLRR